jgi:hypothetical protein
MSSENKNALENFEEVMERIRPFQPKRDVITWEKPRPYQLEPVMPYPFKKAGDSPRTNLIGRSYLI